MPEHRPVRSGEVEVLGGPVVLVIVGRVGIRRVLERERAEHLKGVVGRCSAEVLSGRAHAMTARIVGEGILDSGHPVDASSGGRELADFVPSVQVVREGRAGRTRPRHLDVRHASAPVRIVGDHAGVIAARGPLDLVRTRCARAILDGPQRSVEERVGARTQVVGAARRISKVVVRERLIPNARLQRARRYRIRRLRSFVGGVR